jgi:hypothetical protein
MANGTNYDSTSFFYIDKTTLSYAAIFGIEDDLNLVGTQYSWLRYDKNYLNALKCLLTPSWLDILFRVPRMGSANQYITATTTGWSICGLQ